MPCYSPLTGYKSKTLTENGKRKIVFNTQDGYTDLKIKVPCGQCTGCRIDYSRQWAVRCMHEASLHESNCFITLTYNNENLPGDYSISKTELKNFWKRLRKHTGAKIRYFACGEYGDQNNRPHYHAIIFGYDFSDKYLYNKRNGNLYFRSPLLEKAWQNKGYCIIGNVTFESCAYVSRYVMKKRKGKPDHIDPLTGKTNEEYYLLVDEETGETFNLEPEFCNMSLKPGIGADWFHKYKDTDLHKDYFTIQGKKHKLPNYYDYLIMKDDAQDLLFRKSKRIQAMRAKASEYTPERLEIKEKVLNHKLKLLTRGYENET
jgi:hypothetical protein